MPEREQTVVGVFDIQRVIVPVSVEATVRCPQRVYKIETGFLVGFERNLQTIERVGLDVEPLVYLSHAAGDATEVEGSFSINCLGGVIDDTCTEPNSATCNSESPNATVTYDANNQVARLVPEVSLQSDTCYELVVTAGIAAVGDSIGPLPVDVRSSFRTQ